MTEIAVIMKYQFMQHAVFAGILASIVCGIIGVMIVEKKLVMMSGGIAHTSYGGVGLGYLLGFEPIIGAFGFSIFAALAIGFMKKRVRTHTDLLIGMFWSLGMALGILFIALLPGYPPEISSYLFGSILSVTASDLIISAVLTGAVVCIVVSLFSCWKAFLFDEEFSFVSGIRTSFLNYLLLVLIALSVVVLIRVVGIILILALFTAPPAIAARFTRTLGMRMILSACISCFLCLSGLYISYRLNIPSGASIVILSAAVYGICILAESFKRTRPL